MARGWYIWGTRESTECTRSWTCRRESSLFSIRWVDKDDYHTAKARLTARGYEQELIGQENFNGATPQPATLRLLLVMAQALGLAVAVGDCAQAFLQAPLLEKNEVWVTPPPEAEVKPGRAWRLPAA